ncbi:hypothetical protein H257_13006 [Aphanomyces astaci]|uniref:Chromo domain-containing protein n=1 Tax=Aphanomyces astaci TaxID=112090 RepID=W4FYW8_APHAT|nr:hypothetical protein H257_13006 [Aphanomyces astaci]ETV71873.1 hypothetical protein H257_13006 [Aphanomyces astaci]|eukprot:XP_009838722.1 hypothetical protein H257_13006 [Aphanomyces astaci]
MADEGKKRKANEIAEDADDSIEEAEAPEQQVEVVDLTAESNDGGGVAPIEDAADGCRLGEKRRANSSHRGVQKLLEQHLAREEAAKKARAAEEVKAKARRAEEAKAIAAAEAKAADDAAKDAAEAAVKVTSEGVTGTPSGDGGHPNAMGVNLGCVRDVTRHLTVVREFDETREDWGYQTANAASMPLARLEHDIGLLLAPENDPLVAVIRKQTETTRAYDHAGRICPPDVQGSFAADWLGATRHKHVTDVQVALEEIHHNVAVRGDNLRQQVRGRCDRKYEVKFTGFSVSDFVLVGTVVKRPTKMALDWRRPCQVTRVITGHMMVPPYEIKVHHACRLKMYQEDGREVTDDLQAQIAFVDGGFHVECLDEARCMHGQHQVLVKRLGLDDEESSWEPPANLLDDILVVFRKWTAANKEDPAVAALIKTLEFP